MQLIVNISEKVYREVKDRSIPSGYNANDCYDAIWKGIPLPEGHGRLIDADKLRAEYTRPNLVGYDDEIKLIDEQPTVVEGEVNEC